jgi:hypothetical protein
MSKVLERIARENFRTAGYITHPRRESRSSWTYTTPPSSPFHSKTTLRDALQRRERATLRNQTKPSLLKHWIHVFLHR